MRQAAFFTCFFLLAVTGLCFISAGKINSPLQRRLVLHFRNTIGGETLEPGKTYTNVLGENITVQKFKYYVSNFMVTDETGKIIKLPARYFLVDAADSLSCTIVLNIPAKSLRNIRFLLGVDSIRNVSGVQTGALDPLKGMFWTWNSGYIMAKLEGSSEQSMSPGHYFTYHIGGFRNEMNTSREIELALPKKNEPIKQVDIDAEINQWFKSRSELKIAETPICHSPGELAARIADNYSTMFSINSVH
jgi:hypothetical protein